MIGRQEGVRPMTRLRALQEPGDKERVDRLRAGHAPAIACALLLSIASAAPAAARCSDHAGPGVDWSKCDKMRLMMGGSDLSGGAFTQTFFSSTDLHGANFAGSDLTRAELSNARLSEANLAGAVLQKATASRTDFSGADLSNADLSGAEFSRSKFHRANLAGADFKNSEMNRSDFTEADLTGANMSKAELARVIFKDAVIQDVSFSFSNLSRADLIGTDIGNADLSGAYTFLTRLGGTDLSKAKGLTEDQLAMACGSETTLLPAGMSAPPNWPCPDYDDD